MLRCLCKLGWPLWKAARCRQGPNEYLWSIRCQSPHPQTEGRQELMELRLRNAWDTKLILGLTWNEAVC